MVTETFLTIGEEAESISLLENFLHTAGDSLKTFRYFEKRPLSVVGNHLLTVLLMHDGIPVGYGHLDREADTVWLGIAILASSTGKGLGKKLMQFLVEQSEALHINRLMLSVDQDNTAAIALYNRFGFSFVKNINERSVVMERKTGAHA